jgi:hypothetical protein
MSGLNRRGPYNDGPMTGRQMGRCNPLNKGLADSEILHRRESLMQDDTDFRGRIGQELGRRHRQNQGLGNGIGLGRKMGMRFRGNV